MAEIDPHRYSGPLEDLEKNGQEEQSSNLRLKIILAAGLGVLLVSGIVAYFLFINSDTKEIVDSESTPAIMISFIPIWIAVFIPLMISKNKKPQNAKSSQVSLVIGVAAALVIIGAVIVFFVAGQA